jgi:peroxidase
MKLLPALLAGSITATDERGLKQNAQNAIHHAHSRVRNGFTLPIMNDITDSNERLLAEVFSEDFSTRSTTLEEMVHRSTNITNSFLKQGECDSSFPTLDGSCNHPEDFGRSMQPYKRLVPADYCDGRQSPRCSRNNRQALPSERKVSLEMRSTGTTKTNNVASFAFTAWGQFITHDIIQTPDVGQGEVPCTCKPHNQCKVIAIERRTEPVLKFPCMFVIRSSSKLGQQNGQPVREQINQLSSFIDGTTVYGFTVKHKNMLLADDKMRLRMSRNNQNGDFLPTVNSFNQEIKDKFSTTAAFNDKRHAEFVAGDTRVLENPILSSFHTLFARLHNRAVDGMLEQNPDWAKTPDRVFEEARLFVMSVIKQITYREHLPVLLGNTAMKEFPAVRVSRAHKRPKNTRFAKFPDEEEVAARSVRFTVAAMDDPSIRQEFITSAYRFGHAMIPDQLITADGNLNSNSRRELKDNYFDPDMVFQMGPGSCLRGAMAGNTNTVSGIYSDATQHQLFKPNNFGHGVDLLAINLAVCCLRIFLFVYLL